MATHSSILTVSDEQSPKFRTSSQSEDLSSTPHASFVRPGPMDLSAISSIASDQSLAQDHRVQAAAASFCEPPQPELKKEREVYTQSELDILYNSYIQWTFLDNALQKKIKDDERKFMAETHVLWQENQKLREEVADLDRQIADAEYLKNLDHVVAAHSAESAMKSIDEYARDHSALAEGLDTTRHQLPLTGVHIPCDTETYSEFLAELLCTALDTTKDLVQCLNVDERTMEESSVTAKSLLNNLDEMNEYLDTTGELTRELKRLTVQESSLNVQKKMERSEN